MNETVAGARFAGELQWIDSKTGLRRALDSVKPDLVLMAADSSAKVQAHVYVVAAASPVLQSLLMDDTSLGCDCDVASVVLECSEDTLRNVVDIIYTGKTKRHDHRQSAELRLWLNILGISNYANSSLFCNLCPDDCFSNNEEIYAHFDTHLNAILNQYDSILKQKSETSASNTETQCKGCHKNCPPNGDATENKSPLECHLEECSFDIMKQRDVYKISNEEKPTTKVAFRCQQCAKVFKSNFSLRQHEKKCPSAAPSERDRPTPPRTTPPRPTPSRKASSDAVPMSTNGAVQQQRVSRQQKQISVDNSLDYCLKIAEVCFVPGCSSQEKPTSAHLFSHDVMDVILETEFPATLATFLCPCCSVDFDERPEFIMHMKKRHWSDAPPAILKEYSLQDIILIAEQKAMEAASASPSRSNSALAKTRGETPDRHLERRTPSPPSPPQTATPKKSAQPNDIRCSKCKETFPSKESKKLHTCNSIVDRKGIADDRRDVRKSKPQIGSLIESPIKKTPGKRKRSQSGPKPPQTKNVPDQDSDEEPSPMVPLQQNAPKKEVDGSKKPKLLAESSDSEESGGEETTAAKGSKSESSSSSDEVEADSPEEEKECEHCGDRFRTRKEWAFHIDGKHPELRPW